MPDFIRCPSCGEHNPTGLSVCEKCGEPLRGGEHVIVTGRDVDEATGRPIVRAIAPGDPPVIQAAQNQLVEPRPELRVVVTDFDMPFWSMAGFMIKWGLAAIPAAVLLFFIFVVLAAVFGILSAPARLLK